MFIIPLTCVCSDLLSHLHSYGLFSPLLSSWLCYSVHWRQAMAASLVRSVSSRCRRTTEVAVKHWTWLARDTMIQMKGPPHA